MIYCSGPIFGQFPAKVVVPTFTLCAVVNDSCSVQSSVRDDQGAVNGMWSCYGNVTCNNH